MTNVSAVEKMAELMQQMEENSPRVAALQYCLTQVAEKVEEAEKRNAELEARCVALAAENANARSAVQVFCDVVGANTDAICEEVGQDGVRTILAAMNATGNMPSTDAFLAEVRAQGVEMAMEHMQSSGSLTFGDCYISLNEFAAQLRKGVQS